MQFSLEKKLHWIWVSERYNYLSVLSVYQGLVENIKLLPDLKSHMCICDLKSHMHIFFHIFFIYVYACPVNIHCNIPTAQSDLSLSYRTLGNYLHSSIFKLKKYVFNPHQAGYNNKHIWLTTSCMFCCTLITFSC